MRDSSSLKDRPFGRLISKEIVGKDKSGKNYYWRCECLCGGEIVTLASNLRNGRTQSCGCLQKEVRGKCNITHGHTRNGKVSSEYIAWMGMRDRCFNPNGDSYPYYGGRGITVCEKWCASFENFFSDIGPKPSPDHSLDRIDVNGHYEPTNCKWATKKEQMVNRRVHCARCGEEMFCQKCGGSE